MRTNYVLILMLAACSSVGATQKSCAEHPKIISACFEVDGKLAFYNGSPSVRIELENGRIMGVSEGRFYEEGYDNLPPELIEGLNFSLVLNGTFTVCPFTEEKVGKMSLICIESAKNVQRQPRD